MKKQILLAAALLLLAAGCRKAEPDTVPPVSPEGSERLAMDTLAVEISRGDMEAQALTAAIRELPPLLKEAFAEAEVDIGEITVTVGASPANTIEALTEGGVDLAFLPAESFWQQECTAVVLLADAGEATGSAQQESGVRALICAAPTAYGAQLNARAASGKPLSWQELSNARWGVLKEDRQGSYGAFDLWLSDEHEGKRITDLPDVEVYSSYEALFRAAARGEIDALALREDVRSGAAELWIRKETSTDTTTIHGYGRETEIWTELPVLEITERLCVQLVVVTPQRPELAQESFAEALEQVLEQLAEETPEQMEALGAVRFAAVMEEDLLPTQRWAKLGE